jgi:hypothetical protein
LAILSRQASVASIRHLQRHCGDCTTVMRPSVTKLLQKSDNPRQFLLPPPCAGLIEPGPMQLRIDNDFSELPNFAAAEILEIQTQVSF